MQLNKTDLSKWTLNLACKPVSTVRERNALTMQWFKSSKDAWSILKGSVCDKSSQELHRIQPLFMMIKPFLY